MKAVEGIERVFAEQEAFLNSWDDGPIQEGREWLAKARTELADMLALVEAADAFLTALVDQEYRLPVSKAAAMEAALARVKGDGNAT